ncbi:phage/plasmid primase, P4 family [Halotia wernerae UHCC 0503]|nr:phage/plasmid primase, P4 family [Halotia wernerae UHCC 0503]
MHTTQTTATLTANRLTDRHYKECVTNRGLCSEWIAVNCRSMEIKEASQRLGYTALSAGIWLEGVNGFGQFRPNKPWKSVDEKKAPKYRTATREEYDAMLPRHPHNPRYWEDLDALKALCYNINGHPCLLLTEGLFKALAGCSNGFPTVAIAGVEQALTSAANDPQGKRYLVDTLELLARAKFGWIIAFDADERAQTNKNVVVAQRKLAYQLAKFKVPVYIATGLWSAAEGKGMDDYIQANGGDAFRENVLVKAVNLETWERQFQKDDKDNKTLSEAAFAAQIAENYRDRLAWHVANKAWYWYEAQKKLGVWGEIPHEEAQDIIVTELRSLTQHFSYRFVASTLNLLKGDLRINHWEVCPGYICLEDCVLDINTLKEYPHAPGYRMLTQLPFKWSDRNIGCEPIQQWLLEICEGQENWVEVIRAAINATITERGGKMQRYLELIGAGGTGKGTLLRLVQDLVGKDNYAITTLKQLEQNRFETASFYGKKLICITDSERYTGDVSVFKAITGYDDLRHEKKGVQQTGSFKFNGVVMVAANEAMQSTDYTNATARRRLSMPFNRVIPPHQRRDLMEEFAPYLPGLLSWVLSMPEAEIKDYFVDTNNKVSSLAAFSKEILMETNPLANWADECLYYDPNAVTGIGDISQNAQEFLYANYAQWANNNGQGTMNKQRFSSTLLNLLKAQLGIDASKRKTNRGRFITCVAIRKPGHDFPLLISTSDDLNQKSDDLVTTSVTTQTLGSDGLLSSDDLFTSKTVDPSNNQCYLMQSPIKQNQEGRSSLDSNSSLTSVSGSHEVVTVTTSNPSKVVTTPSVIQQMINNWDDKSSLGQLVLSLKLEELHQAVAGFNIDQLQHIKDAANSVWRLGADSLADYNGELVYIWECGQSNDVRIGTKTQPGVKVRRAHIRPWLGI